MATPAQAAEAADHHYVPKFYLKGFMDKQKKLWVYDKGSNEPRESKPKKEGHRPNYYVFTEGGKPNESAEDMLKKIESIVSETVRKLANPQFEMTGDERANLYAFAALTFVRVPAYREFIDNKAGESMKRFLQDQAKDKKDFDDLIKGYEQRTGKPMKTSETLREVILGNGYSIEQKSVAYNLLLTFQSGLEIAAILETEFQYDLIYAPAGSLFVTCDNPIMTVGPDGSGHANIGVGFGWLNTQVIFPLNKRVCLVLSRNAQKQKVEATERTMDQFNGLIMFAAQKHLYAAEGTRRLARIFNERGCKAKFGETIFIPGFVK